MLYIVTGYMRTGTSMMMKAMEAGGLDAEYSQSRDVMKNHYSDKHYDPNIGGLYELAKQDYQHPNFPRMYDGKVIKALNAAVPRMRVVNNGVRVVFMRRDTEEIRQSYQAFFGHPSNIGTYFQTRMDEFVKSIRNRKDVISCHEFQYRDVVNDPIGAFYILQADGWPINPEKAASVIDPEYCRFKKENLEKGIV